MESTETTIPVPETVAVMPPPAVGSEAAPAPAATENVPQPGAATPGPGQCDTMAGALQFQGASARPTPQTYEFAQLALLGDPELRKLRTDYAEFLGSLAMRLAIYFRTEFDLTLGSLQMPTYRQFVGGLAQPTHLTLFKVEPLRGLGVLEISPAFGLAMTDRLLGGPGEAAVAVRELSEIEVALLDQVAQFLTEGWCGLWRRRPELKPVLLGHESDAHYLQTSPPESPMLVATMNARLGKVTGRIQLAFAFATLEPLLEPLRAELKPPAESAPEVTRPKPGPWNPSLNDVPIAMAAQLPGPQLLARALPQLKVGEVLELPVDSANHVQLRLGSQTRFTGRLGTRDNYWAVEVTDVLKS